MPEPKPRTVEIVDNSYQPTQEEINEPIEVPADLATLPMPKRLEEGARRLIGTVKIRRVGRPRK